MIGIYTMPTHPVRLTTARKTGVAEREKKSERLNITLEESLKNEVREFAARRGQDLSEFARIAFSNEMAGDGIPPDEHSLSLPVFYNAPCGPFAEVVEGTEPFTINEEVADFLEADTEDSLFQVEGESMIGAGIVDGAMVVVRPYGNKRPVRRDIVFIQYRNEQDEWKATVKRFDGGDLNAPRLLNGAEESVELPEEARDVAIVGRVIAQMSRLK